MCKVWSILPSPIELIYFHETVITGNISHAAKKLNISQPTLSMAIKRLEGSLKVTLFYRQKQGLILTRAGSELFQHVRMLLAQWDKIQIQINSSHQEIKGRVVIGCNSAYVPFIAKAVSELIAHNPALLIDVVSESTQKITDGILNVTIDIGLAVNPQEHANFVMNTISCPEITFWARKDSTQVNKSLISGETVVICDPSIPQTNMLLEQLPVNLNIRRTYTNSLESIAHLTVNGDGIGILPECFVRAFYRGQLEKVHGSPYYKYKSCLIYRVEDKELAVIQLIISRLKDTIESHKEIIGMYK